MENNEIAVLNKKMSVLEDKIEVMMNTLKQMDAMLRRVRRDMPSRKML